MKAKIVRLPVSGPLEVEQAPKPSRPRRSGTMGLETTLPAPPVPADCDLRGLGWFKFFGDQAFASDSWALASDRSKVAMIQIWWASWKQVPAASLPDDDRILAVLAGFGNGREAAASWAEVRSEVMRGWTKCRDGRLYHPFLAGLALEAWKGRVKHAGERERNAERLRRWRAEQRQRAGQAAMNEGETRFNRVSDTARNAVETHVREGEGEGDKSIPVSSTSSSTVGGVASAPPTDKASRGQRIPADWTPSEATVAWASEKGLRWESEVAGFLDYWTAEGGQRARKVDWQAAFRVWLSRSAGGGRGTGQGRPATAQDRRMDSLFELQRILDDDG